MAHIVEFTIEGLAGRQEPYSSRLNRDVNIFFGPNGSGKTSLLKILHSALSVEGEIVKAVPFTAASVTVYSDDYQRTFVYTIRRQVTVEPPTVSEQVASSPAKEPSAPKWERVTEATDLKGLKDSWRHRYLPTSRLYLAAGQPPDLSAEYLLLTGARGARRSRGEEDLDALFADSLRRLWSQYAAEISRAVRQAQEEGLANILRAVLFKGTGHQPGAADAKKAYETVSAFLHRQRAFTFVEPEERFIARYEGDEQLRSVVADIEEVERKIEVAVAPQEALKRLVGEMFLGSKSVIFTDTGIDVVTAGAESIGLRTLSSGEKHLLRIFVEQLLAESGSMIIDEPEISMHVDWQKKLVRALRDLNPKSQLIMATHSPEVMADVPDGDIFRI